MSDTALRSDAPGDAAGGVLVIGYGNALRSDDGVGWHAAGLLAADPRLAAGPRLAADAGSAADRRPGADGRLPADPGPAAAGFGADAWSGTDSGPAAVEILALHQLTPELALDMSRASLVILIDASTDDPPGAIAVRRLAAGAEVADRGPGGAASHGTGGGADVDARGGPGDGPGHAVGGGPGATSHHGGPGATSHHVGPDELLAVTRELYGTAPEAFVVSVGVVDMDAGESLSPVVAAALPGVADVVVDLIAAHSRAGAAHQPR